MQIDAAPVSKPAEEKVKRRVSKLITLVHVPHFPAGRPLFFAFVPSPFFICLTAMPKRPLIPLSALLSIFIS